MTLTAPNPVRSAAAPLLLVAFMVSAALACLPGLHGGFIFDDFANLPALGKYGTIDSFADLWRYLSTGIGGPTGRPLSLASFLLDDNGWPSDPYQFKRTNLAVHIINGLLVAWLSLVLLRRYLDEAGAQTAAAIAGGIWTLNSLHVSTTLYVVQRMAQLSATATIAGLLIFALARGGRPSYWRMSLGVFVAVGIGIACKENAIGAPLMFLALNGAIRRAPRGNAPPLDRRWTAVFLLLPVLAFFSYVAINWETFQAAFADRGFTLYQRLITQARVLAEYLYLYLVPHTSTRGILQDAYPVSTGITAPATTLAALLLHAALATLAIALRRRAPLITLAIAFFYAGHCIESTVLPLELYFEHRNYLPSIFLALPLVLAWQRLFEKHGAYAVLLIGAYCLAQGGATYARASLWGNKEQLLLVWADANPASSRAVRSAAIALADAGHYTAAIDLLERGPSSVTRDPAVRIHRNILYCVTGSGQGDLEATIAAINDSRFDYRNYLLLETLVRISAGYRCPQLSAEQSRRLLRTLLSNEAARDSDSFQGNLHHLLGESHALTGAPDEALRQFQAALRKYPSQVMGMQQVSLLAENGFQRQALGHLDTVAALVRTQSSKGDPRDFAGEIERLRAILREDLAAPSAAR